MEVKPIDQGEIMGYKHLTIKEKESILVGLEKGLNLSQIALSLRRNRSTISREIKRGSINNQYSIVQSEENYKNNRVKCRMKKRLDNINLRDYVAEKILVKRWSPEQIVNRATLEGMPLKISYHTIYRGLNAGEFDRYLSTTHKLKATRKLRHRGKKRHKKGLNNDKRGTFEITHNIEDRPTEATARAEKGHWELDTVIGIKGGSCLVTITDRKTRFLLCARASKKSALEVNKVICKLLKNKPCKSITPDRGKEFALYKLIEKTLNTIVYFPSPHQPWQRGTNENTNGLLREYFPKGKDLSLFTENYINDKIDELNKRPRKCLNWLSPFEAYYGVVLHLAC